MSLGATDLADIRKDTERTFALLKKCIDTGKLAEILSEIEVKTAAGKSISPDRFFCESLVIWLLEENDGLFPIVQLEVVDKFLNGYKLLPIGFSNFSKLLASGCWVFLYELDFNKADHHTPMITCSSQPSKSREQP